MKKLFRNKTVLVFGGTGTIGTEIVRQVLKYNPKTVRIFSNDENSLWEKRLEFEQDYKILRFLLGDIRDFERVKRATEGVDIVFNASAVKHVPFCEYNPIEAVGVNIIGLENIIKACFEFDVDKLIHISTDKAINPSSVMGATKMICERLGISRELSKGNYKTKISCVRFGNVLGSRGSIIPLIKRQIENGNTVLLTDEKMTRFFMTVDQAVKLVLKTVEILGGGEIFVLKMPVIRIKDLIEIIIEEYSTKIGKDPKSIKIKVIGIRKGEKISEDLIAENEVSNCYKSDDMFVIYPFDYLNEIFFPSKIVKNICIVEENFSYNSKDIEPLSKKKVRTFLKHNKLI